MIVFKILKLLFLPILWLAYLLSFLSKRDHKRVILGSISDFVPRNIEIIYNELINSGYDAVVIGSKIENVKCTDKYSILYFKFVLTAKYFVYTHYVSDIGFWFSGRVKLVNLWHGHPLKKIERDYENNSFFYSNNLIVLFRMLFHPYRYITNFKIICHYEYFASIFERAFNIEKKLIYECKEIRDARKVCIEDFDVLYMPTFRPVTLSKNHSIELNNVVRMLNRNQISYYYKLHPVDSSLVKYRDRKLNKNIDPFDAFLSSKILITDYSSIIIDYLGVHPKGNVILFLHDENEYKKMDRDFYPIWDQIKKSCTVVRSLEDLEDAIQKFLKNSPDSLQLNLMPFKNEMRIHDLLD